MCDTIFIRFEQGAVNWSVPDASDEQLSRVARGIVEKIRLELGSEMFAELRSDHGVCKHDGSFTHTSPFTAWCDKCGLQCDVQVGAFRDTVEKKNA